jgi:uncharacterized membrane protein
MKSLINHFLQGLLYTAPIGITAYIIYKSFIVIDDALKEYIMQFFKVEIPGLGLFSLVIILILIGFIGKTIIANPIRATFQKLLKNIPVLNFIYTALNDLFKAFMGNEKKFDRAVLVKVNLNSDLQKLGFITRDRVDFLKDDTRVAVYFPHSYNFS